jgi:hypothetical protein
MALSTLEVMTEKACYYRDKSCIELNEGFSEAGVRDSLSHNQYLELP